MANIRSNTFILGVHSSAIFTLFAVLLSVTVLGQSAYAQSDSVGFLYEPGIEAVTAFATGIAESAPKIIAAVILLIIGLIAGKVIGKVVEKSASKLLQKVTRNNDNDDVVTQTTSSRDSSKLIAAYWTPDFKNARVQ